MPAFEYIAINSEGRQKKGILEGDSAKSIRQKLRSQGLIPIDLQAIEKHDDKSAVHRFRPDVGKKMNITELALFTRQLATLLKSATPLEEALKTISKQSERPRVKRTILAVRSKVIEGHSLEEGLNLFQNTFPELYRATVSAGERSGHLDPVLERLAQYTETRQEMQQSIFLAIIYPLILLVICILVVMGLLTYVVPQVVDVFVDMGNELPLPTRFLLASSEFLKNTWFYQLISVVMIVLAFTVFMKNPVFRKKIHAFQLRLPIIGKLLRGMYTARFARTLSILMAAGVPVLEALRISSEVIPNIPMKNAVRDAANNVREGEAIHSSLESSGFFPAMTLHLIASGEVSGNLEIMLERAATQQERELKTLIGTVLGLFEPMMIVLMGIIVLFIVLAIMLPIFEINQLVA